MYIKKLTRICSFLIILSILGNYVVIGSAEGINNSSNNEQLTSGDAGSVSGDAAKLFKYIENEDGTLTIYRYDGTDETVVFPSEIDGKKVSSIGDSSGQVVSGRVINSNTTKSVVISEGITNLEYAFYECNNLVTVSLPNTLKIIGEHTFDSCYNLISITLPEGLTDIGDAAFWGCNSIEKLVIPDSVTNIGESTFYMGHSEYITLYGNPHSYIKTYADTHDIKFSCINHQNIITDVAVAPTCVKSGKTEGSHCSDCGMVFVEQDYIAPTGQHTWIDGTCTVCKKVSLQLPVPDVTTEKLTEMSSSVPSVKHDYEIAGVKKGDTITDSYGCYKVTNSNEKKMTVEFTSPKRKGNNFIISNTVEIKGVSYKVTSIAKNAFKNNKTLKNVTISSNITTISANAFKGCSNLKTIKIKSKNMKSVGKNAFNGINTKAKIKVPSSSLKKYKKLLSNKGQKSTVKIIK